MTNQLRTLLFQSVLGGITVNLNHHSAMNGAATQLSETLLENVQILPDLALTAFVSGGPAEALTGVSTVLETHWPTFHSEVLDGGMPYLRAVAIMALLQQAEQNAVFASGLYLLLVDPLTFSGDAREAALREYVLSSLRAPYLQASRAAWENVSTAVSVPRIAVTAPGQVGVSEESIETAQTNLVTAMSSAQITTSYSPNYGNYQPVQVQREWATAVSASIVDVVSTLLEEITAPLAEAVAAPLQELPKFTVPLTEALSRSKRAERRLNVMWWMQARYSASLGTAYRTLGPAAGACQMAFDLCALVPHPAPPEVEVVLDETWRSVFGEPTQQGLLLLLKAATAETIADEREKPGAGYSDVLHALDVVTPRTTPKQLQGLTGVPGGTPLDAPTLALWMFRTRQARILLS